VVVVSDSILLGARAPMSARLERAGWSVVFDGSVNRTTLNGASVVRSHAAELTDTLVVSLGANDSASPATFRQRVEAVMAAAAGVPTVYWLTIREIRPYYGPANQVLRDAAARHPNLRVIDWNAASANRSDLTVGDGLHLSGSGSEALGSLVATTLAGSDDLVTGAAAVLPPAPVPAPAPPAPVPVPTTTVPVPEPTPTTVTDLAAPSIGRSVFVAPLGSELVASTPAGGPGHPRVVTAPTPGSGPWPWVLLVVVSVIGVALVGRRTGFPGVSGPVLHAEISRVELRQARLAQARSRHPSVAVVPPPPREWLDPAHQES